MELQKLFKARLHIACSQRFSSCLKFNAFSSLLNAFASTIMKCCICSNVSFSVEYEKYRRLKPHSALKYKTT